MTDLLKEKMEKTGSAKKQSRNKFFTLHQAEEDLKTIDYLYENFNIGMNVFRTARADGAKLENRKF